jgi:hypothetical protein
MSGEERFRRIVNLLNEARDEVEHCAFHSRGNGMSAFACAEVLMRDVSFEELARYMDIPRNLVRRFAVCSTSICPIPKPGAPGTRSASAVSTVFQWLSKTLGWTGLRDAMSRFFPGQRVR